MNRIFTLFFIKMLLLSSFIANSQTTELFFSEYSEGSIGNNKYIEIFNGTGSDVDMGEYLMLQNSNGGPIDEYVYHFSDTIADGGVYVIANSQCDTAITNHADLMGSGICYFNGDDARALAKIVTDGSQTDTIYFDITGDNVDDTVHLRILDYIGEFPNDPGDGWAVAGVANATKDHTLIRKPHVIGPNNNWASAAGMDSISSEWIVMPANDWSNINIHNTGTPPPPAGDTLPPFVTLAYAMDQSTVKVVFNEALNSTATQTSNYTGLGTVSQAMLSSSMDTVTLSLSLPLSMGVPDTLTVNNVQDTSNNTMINAQSFPIIYNGSVDLVITEIMYNPPESGNDSLEFIEIYNNGSNPVFLGGMSLSEGVTYSFPAISLNSGDYFVVAVNANAMYNTFGVTAYEWASGGLGNDGEDIEIIDIVGNVIDYVDYDDGGNWPFEADGDGPSLTFCTPSLDNNVDSNWVASYTLAAINADGDSIYATPGAPCGGTVGIEDVSISEIDIYPNPATDYVIIDFNKETVHTLRMFNLVGEKIEEIITSELTIQLNISDLTSGMYILQLADDSGRIVFNSKLIKE